MRYRTDDINIGQETHWTAEQHRQAEDKQYLEDFGSEWLTAIWLRRIETHLAHIKVILIVSMVIGAIAGFIWAISGGAGY